MSRVFNSVDISLVNVVGLESFIAGRYVNRTHTYWKPAGNLQICFWLIIKYMDCTNSIYLQQMRPHSLSYRYHIVASFLVRCPLLSSSFPPSTAVLSLGFRLYALMALTPLIRNYKLILCTAWYSLMERQHACKTAATTTDKPASHLIVIGTHCHLWGKRPWLFTDISPFTCLNALNLRLLVLWLCQIRRDWSTDYHSEQYQWCQNHTTSKKGAQILARYKMRICTCNWAMNTEISTFRTHS